ncbi:MAG: hypothetical protein WDN72_01890 [Alphaproteobacteria bacterium]
MKKLLLTGALVLAGTTAANAAVNVGINVGDPYYGGGYYAPYAAPQPVYYGYGWGHERRHYDWGYWNHQDRFNRDDHHDAHDNGHHDAHWHR